MTSNPRVGMEGVVKTYTGNCGITIIETLSTITIITILASMLMGAIGMSYEKSKQVSCIYNQHQIINIVLAYALDEEKFPTSLASIEPYLQEKTNTNAMASLLLASNIYAAEISGYYGANKSILRCPKVNGTMFDTIPVYSYGFNADVIGLNYSKISNHSDAVVLAESDQSTFFSFDDMISRHFSGIVVSFADGHVEVIRDFIPLGVVETFVDLPFEIGMSIESNGFTFTYTDLEDNGDGTSKISFTIKNDNNKKLNRAIFELPEGAKATDPADGETYYAENGQYNVLNTHEVPFHSIRFNALGSSGIKDGGTDTFSFSMNNTDIATIENMRVEAKGSNYVGGGIFE